MPYINVPLHTLLVVRSYGYEFKVEAIPLQVECVDTYRVRPKVSFHFPHFFNHFKCSILSVYNLTNKIIIVFFSLSILQNCSPDRKESDVLETVPAHFDAPLPPLPQTI